MLATLEMQPCSMSATGLDRFGNRSEEILHMTANGRGAVLLEGLSQSFFGELLQS